MKISKTGLYKKNKKKNTKIILDHYRSRHYPDLFIEDSLTRVLALDKTSILQPANTVATPNEYPLFWILPYPPVNHYSPKHSPTPANGIKPTKIFKKNTKLQILSKTGKAQSTSRGRIYIVRQTFTCRFNNLIYLITYVKCKSQYVGQTKKSIMDRFQRHLLDIKHLNIEVKLYKLKSLVFHYRWLKSHQKLSKTGPESTHTTHVQLNILPIIFLTLRPMGTPLCPSL